ASAHMNSKTSYQRTSAHSDKEERTFDLHVRVEVRNTDMPAGTERLMTLLENVITERKAGGSRTVQLRSSAEAAASQKAISSADTTGVLEGAKTTTNGQSLPVASRPGTAVTMTENLADKVDSGTLIPFSNPAPNSMSSPAPQRTLPAAPPALQSAATT